MIAQRRALLAIAIASILLLSLVYLAWNDLAPQRQYSNFLADGGFEDGVCFSPPAGVEVTRNQCTSSWSVFTNYGTVPADSLAQVVNQPTHSGNHALELKIPKVQGDLDITAIQHLNQSGCVSPGESFGLKMQRGLTLSFWYQGVNISGVGFNAVVVFHNGTSKLAIAYHLEPSTIVGYKINNLNLSNGGSVDVYLNSSAPYWKESSFDIYNEFVRYFGIDPILNHYCVNYVSLGLSELGGGFPTINASAPYAYGYFDDVELYAKS